MMQAAARRGVALRAHGLRGPLPQPAGNPSPKRVQRRLEDRKATLQVLHGILLQGAGISAQSKWRAGRPRGRPTNC